ncbi:MAG: hypothetical protein BWY15_01379 [Firmicutes bacterium ADurb.Bin193]|nr:MAG: hypothetical protein BWY15_01379 [Firmicutes bacterium ADurb.Bin193]
MSISDNIKIINEKIEAAAQRSGRSLKDITLVAVTKTVGVPQINEAIAAGVKVLGENRVQELTEKYPLVSGAAWHLIGHLQTNKVKYIVGKVGLIHSVDSIRLAQEIDKRAKARGIVQDILIEINISGEATKFGISPDYIEEFIGGVQNMQNIKVCGLMTIAPLGATRAETAKLYENCNNLLIDIGGKKYHNIHMTTLSMGMSGDFEIAIECGANVVRIGTGIFGRRNYNL